MANYAKDDAVAALRIREATHGSRSSPHFAKGPLDPVGGAHFLPVSCGNLEEVQWSL